MLNQSKKQTVHFQTQIANYYNIKCGKTQASSNGRCKSIPSDSHAFSISQQVLTNFYYNVLSFLLKMLNKQNYRKIIRRKCQQLFGKFLLTPLPISS
jgi:hypothetical protein